MAFKILGISLYAKAIKKKSIQLPIYSRNKGFKINICILESRFDAHLKALCDDHVNTYNVSIKDLPKT